MKYVMSIDGGGTKTKFILATTDGKRVSECTLKTIHYLQIGFDKLEKRINEGIQICTNLANINKEDILSVFLGCPGYGDIKKDTEKLDNSIHNSLKEFKYEVGNDTDNAHAGSLAGKPGINVIAGTGSIGLGINEEGERFISGGWHHIFGGDEGSGYWLSSKLIQEFTQQSDHRKQKTLLYDYLKKELNLQDDTEILDLIINEYKEDRSKIASLSKHLTALANLNDPAAIAIFEEAAFELAKIYIAIAKSLSFNEKIIASYSGGVFKSKEHILKPLKNNLNKAYITLVEPLYEPDIGGVILALKIANIELTQEILSNLSQ